MRRPSTKLAPARNVTDMSCLPRCYETLRGERTTFRKSDGSDRFGIVLVSGDVRMATSAAEPGHGDSGGCAGADGIQRVEPGPGDSCCRGAMLVLVRDDRGMHKVAPAGRAQAHPRL